MIQAIIRWLYRRFVPQPPPDKHKQWCVQQAVEQAKEVDLEFDPDLDKIAGPITRATRQPYKKPRPGVDYDPITGEYLDWQPTDLQRPVTKRDPIQFDTRKGNDHFVEIKILGLKRSVGMYEMDLFAPGIDAQVGDTVVMQLAAGDWICDVIEAFNHYKGYAPRVVVKVREQIPMPPGARTVLRSDGVGQKIDSFFTHTKENDGA